MKLPPDPAQDPRARKLAELREAIARIAPEAAVQPSSSAGEETPSSGPELRAHDAADGTRITLLDLDSPQGTPPRHAVPIEPGSLIELSGQAGCGKTELVLQLLARHPELTRIGWIEERWTAYPPAFEARGIALARLLCCDTQGDSELSHWTALQLLRSGLFGVLVLSISFSRKREERQVQLRRLQLAAERSRTTTFLLHEEPLPEGTWAITHRLAARRVPSH